MSFGIKSTAVSTAPKETNISSEARTVVGSTSQPQDSSTAEQKDSRQSEPLSYPKKESKARRLAKAKAELAQLKVEHAAARLALIELESSDEELTNETQPTSKKTELTSVVTELPTFNGNHRDWVNFRAVYYETANDLTAAENMSRLRRSLCGEAKEAVRRLLINADPDNVIETLQLRFHRPDVIARAECQNLLKLPFLTESPRELIIFATKLKTIVETLQGLNNNVYDLSVIGIGTLVEKLPPTLRQKWSDFYVTQAIERPDLLIFCRFIKKEADKCSMYEEPENVNVKSYVKEEGH